MNLKMLFCPLFLLTFLLRESSLGEIIPSSTTTPIVVAWTKNDGDINVFVKRFTSPESITESILTTTIAGEKKIKELEVPKESKESKKIENIEDFQNSTKKENPTKFIESEDPKECPTESLTCTNPLNEEDTKQFDCEKKKCPTNFFCCKDNCFKHKICKEPSSTNGSDIKSSRVREICPTYDETCVLPADIKNAKFCTDNKCPSGLKCCPDSCFKNNVCKKPDVLIEARIETCPEEPKTCNSFLRDIKIEPRYICNLNMSNCPDDYKCCSDNCHNVNLCKQPKVHVMVQKLIAVTTYQDASQNGTGPVAGKQNATTPQPAGNPSATVPQTPLSPVTPQPAGNQSTIVSQTPSSRTTPQPAGHQSTTVSQTPSSHNAITSSRTTVSQTPTPQPHQSTTTTVSQTSTHPPTTQNAKTTTTPKLNDNNASSVEPLG